MIRFIALGVLVAATVLCLLMAWRWSRRNPGAAAATIHQSGAWQRLPHDDRKRVSDAFKSGGRVDTPQSADAICGRAREQLRTHQNPWLFASAMTFYSVIAVNGIWNGLVDDDIWFRILGAALAIGWPVLTPLAIVDRTRRHTRAARALEANRDLSPEEQSHPQGNW